MYSQTAVRGALPSPPHTSKLLSSCSPQPFTHQTAPVRMMESMTQLMFKGYEEARVALATLLFTVPCCVLVGVEYGVFEKGTLMRVGVACGVFEKGARSCGCGVRVACSMRV